MKPKSRQQLIQERSVCILPAFEQDKDELMRLSLKVNGMSPPGRPRRYLTFLVMVSLAVLFFSILANCGR